MPLEVEITGWSPFEPGDADNASLPVAALEYRFTNRTASPVEAVFSWNAQNFMGSVASGRPRTAAGDKRPAVARFRAASCARAAPTGGKPQDEAAFSATVSDPAVKVNHAWFRGGWFDPLTMAWKDIAAGACYDRPPVTEGGRRPAPRCSCRLTLAPGESKTIVLRLAWYVGQTSLRVGKDPPEPDAACRARTAPGMRAASATSAK